MTTFISDDQEIEKMWTKKKDFALDMERREKQRQEIMIQRRRNDMEEALELGFNVSDEMMPSPTKFTESPLPPAQLLKIEETGPYQEWRLKSLNMYKSHTYEDKLDGNCVFNSFLIS